MTALLNLLSPQNDDQVLGSQSALWFQASQGQASNYIPHALNQLGTLCEQSYLLAGL